MSDLAESKYDIKIKPVKNKARKEKREWIRFIQNYPQLVGLGGLYLAKACQRIQNRAMSKQLDEMMERHNK